MTRTALILGANGFIGAAASREMRARGWRIRGFGRAPGAKFHSAQATEWVCGDLRCWTSPQDWAAAVRNVDVVINCAGALQDGQRDDVKAVHDTAIRALVTACEAQGISRFVQVSAAGVAPDAPTEFFRSKERGDDAVRGSTLNWTILKPGLVIGADAYGGTALIRALAAVPLVLPIAAPDAQFQTVAVTDVARAIARAANGDLPERFEADLVATQPRSLRQIVRAFRQWQGFPPPKAEVVPPNVINRAISRVADALGWLGWRSPLRTTAWRTLEDGVFGDPEPWRAATGETFSNLEATLEEIPSNGQERWFARLYALMPVTIATLALFWLLSGLIGLANLRSASSVLTGAGWSQAAATTSVVAGGLIDIALGLAILHRPAARAACLGMVVMSLAYLAGASLFVPGLWLDPLGPLVKVLPGIVLALIGWVLIETR